jgi:hypothetical protein
VSVSRVPGRVWSWTAQTFVSLVRIPLVVWLYFRFLCCPVQTEAAEMGCSPVQDSLNTPQETQRRTSSVCGVWRCVAKATRASSVLMSRPRALTAPRCMGTLEDITDVAVTVQPLCMRSRYVMTWRWPLTLRTETCYSTSPERTDFDTEYNFKLNYFFI